MQIGLQQKKGICYCSCQVVCDFVKFCSYMSPNHWPSRQPRPKMVTNRFENGNFMQPMGRLSMQSWWALVFSFWGGGGLCVLGGVVFFVFLPCSITAPAISLGQKWWPTVTKNTCSQWVGWSMHSRCLDFFSFKFWVGVRGGFFFIFPLFPICSLYVPFKSPMASHQVPNMFFKFPMCSPRVFPLAPPLIPYVLPKVFPFSSI